jgi:DNA-binding transcriptional LysR family regulator
MRYDLNLLPIFVALMEERSVTRAAERMGMTQPALSNALSRLRLMLQDQLFVRERYGIQPTPIALELSPLIAEALAQLDDAVLGQQAFDPARPNGSSRSRQTAMSSSSSSRPSWRTWRRSPPA